MTNARYALLLLLAAGCDASTATVGENSEALGYFKYAPLPIPAPAPPPIARNPGLYDTSQHCDTSRVVTVPAPVSLHGLSDFSGTLLPPAPANPVVLFWDEALKTGSLWQLGGNGEVIAAADGIDPRDLKQLYDNWLKPHIAGNGGGALKPRPAPEPGPRPVPQCTLQGVLDAPDLDLSAYRVQ
jgi:hypothetical protein